MSSLKRKVLEVIDGWDHDASTLINSAREVPISLIQKSQWGVSWWTGLLDHFKIEDQDKPRILKELLDAIWPQMKKLHITVNNPIRAGINKHVRRRHTRQTLTQEAIRTMNEHIAAAAYRELKRMMVSKINAVAKENPKAANDMIDKLSGQNSPVQDKEQIAKNMARAIWKASIAIENNGKKLNRSKIKTWMNTIKQYGYKVEWRGKSSPQRPLGDRPPVVVSI